MFFLLILINIHNYYEIYYIWIKKLQERKRDDDDDANVDQEKKSILK